MIKTLAMRSDHGNANVNFGAMALIKPYGPYYPSSYHVEKGTPSHWLWKERM